MWKVIYVAARAEQADRVIGALSAAGVACRTRQVGQPQAGGREIMVSDEELEEAQSVLVRVTAGEPE